MFKLIGGRRKPNRVAAVYGQLTQDLWVGAFLRCVPEGDAVIVAAAEQMADEMNGIVTPETEESRDIYDTLCLTYPALANAGEQYERLLTAASKRIARKVLVEESKASSDGKIYSYPFGA